MSCFGFTRFFELGCPGPGASPAVFQRQLVHPGVKAVALRLVLEIVEFSRLNSIMDLSSGRLSSFASLRRAQNSNTARNHIFF